MVFGKLKIFWAPQLFKAVTIPEVRAVIIWWNLNTGDRGSECGGKQTFV